MDIRVGRWAIIRQSFQKYNDIVDAPTEIVRIGKKVKVEGAFHYSIKFKLVEPDQIIATFATRLECQKAVDRLRTVQHRWAPIIDKATQTLADHRYRFLKEQIEAVQQIARNPCKDDAKTG
ncbi:hypothetical protein EVC30_052 [Rhizobium phage RHph_Y1_11]|nr:hypothetical protein EVC30_052 [Rhizobium phage RHph_Y1_11]